MFALLFIITSSNAQIIDEDFEGYTLGPMGSQNPSVWGVWSGNTSNLTESITVSNAFASSGSQSGFIGSGPGPHCLLYTSPSPRD